MYIDVSEANDLVQSACLESASVESAVWGACHLCLTIHIFFRSEV